MNMDSSDVKSALFANLILQQSSMAMVCLGQSPHPQSGKTMRDLEAARLFIDVLEVLAEKTKGNLTTSEETFLNKTLTHLRLTYVQTSSTPASTAPEPAAAAPSGATPPSAQPAPPTTPGTPQ